MYNIGIDLGGTNIAGGIVSATGEIVLKKSVPTNASRGAEAIANDISELCKVLVSESAINPADIKSVGIGSPGVIDPKSGTVFFAANLNFRNVALAELVNKGLEYPVYVENDANCAALGENAFGAAQGSKHSVTVTLGTGVGGGIVIDGTAYSGPFFGAGEVGHHIIVMDGEACTCGAKGCWEAYTSATALIRKTVNAAKSDPSSMINSLVNGKLEEVNAKTAFDAAAAGDGSAKAVVEKYIDYLCIGIVNIVNILQPEAIVIGGGVSGQGSALISMIENRMEALSFGGILKTRIVIAKLGNDAGIIGAAQLSN